MTSQQLPPVVEKVLQQTLVDLTDLGLLGKQAHWNIKGSRFRAPYLQLDEIVGEARVASDDVAERLTALGRIPDACTATVAAASDLKQFDASYLSMDEVCSQFEELLMTVSDRVRATSDPVNDADCPSNDMLVGIAMGLEKQVWVLRSAVANG